MKNIYLVRHAPRDLRIQNDTAPLSAHGLELSEELADYFADKNIKYIITSPSKRAIQTIKPIAHKLKIDWQTAPCLRERWIGFWVSDHDEYIKKQWEDFFYKEGSGESLNDVRGRAIRPFEDLLKEFSYYDNILVCSHRTLIGVILNELTGGEFGYDEVIEMGQPDAYKLTFDGANLVEWERVDWNK